jgi:hypothetical protein
MDGVVVILGVGRIDGDERHGAPVFAAGRRSFTCRFGFGEDGPRKDMRNVVGVNGDQAYGALGLERAEPFDDAAAREAKSSVPAYFDCNEIAVGRARRRFGGNRKFAAELLLVYRNEPTAAARERAENPERAMFGAVDKFYDPSARFLGRGLLDAKERTIADAGNFVGAGSARRMDADDRRRTVDLFVPLGWARQKFAIAIAAGDVGKNDRRQSAGVMQPFAPAIDAALIGQIAQHTLERGAIGVLGAEGARDFADADPAAAFADEGDEFLA